MKIRPMPVKYTGVHNLIAFHIDPKGDDAESVAEIRSQIAKHGAVSYDPSGRKRSKEELERTRYLGILCERVFRAYLRKELEPNARVPPEEPYTGYKKHVDIEIEIPGRKPVTVEVRSSYFNRDRDLPDAVYELHALGPYTTSYKPNEDPKDFYLCGLLYEETKNSFNIGEKHILYFAGGGPYSKFKNEGKETTLGLKTPGKEPPEYLALRISKALDAIEVMDAIRSTISAV